MAGFLRTKFLQRNLQAEKARKRTLDRKEKEDNIIEWTTFYRRNWNVYVERVLGIKLRAFQHFMLWLMCNSDVFFAMCARGASKSFVIGLGAICQTNLYPYSYTVITSSTVPQANKLIEKKIRDEIIIKLSPYLRYMYEKEYIVITKSDDGYKLENKFTHSQTMVLPCLDSARGDRSNFTIYEEARLLKKTIIDSVFEKMAYPRQAMYMQNEEYAKNPRWQEQAKSVYITSARFKSEWFWRTFKDCVTGYYMDDNIRYGVFATDIFTAMDNGLKTLGDYWKSIKMSSELDFRMEDLNDMIGESEDAFFGLKGFRDNQTLEKAFVPPTVTDLYMETDLGNIPKKKETEVRLVVVDYAFANTTTKQKNDQTNIQLISGHWNKGRFIRHWDYLTCHEASDSLGASRRVRELFFDYNADYLVCDLRNGGEVLYNALAEPWSHPERGSLWNPQGFTVSNRSELHVVPETKLEDLRKRCKDPNPIACIIPIVGTADFNHLAWTELKKQLSINNCNFLVDEQHKQSLLEDSGEYYQLSVEKLADILLPYVETTSLVYEAINLKAEWKNDKLKLVEPRSGTKDKAVVCAYGNYIMSKIELQWAKLANSDDSNAQWDEFQFIF